MTTTEQPTLVRRWIAWPDVGVLPTPSGGAPTGRLGAGSVVQVLIDGEVARLVGARVSGWVPVAALADHAVKASDFDGRLSTALGALDDQQALRVAEAMLVLQPDHKAALEVVAALVAGTDWRRSRALLAKRGARTTATLPEEPTAAAGQRGFVVASSLKLRRTAARDGAFLADLPIATAVDVVAVDGEWARVRWTPLTTSMVVFPRSLLQQEGGATDSVPVTAVDGFVAAGFLSSTAPTLAALREKATTATDPLIRSAWWQRALALEPCNDELRKTAAAAAVAAGLFFEAAHDTRAPSCGAASTSTPTMVWAGCRGAPSVATTVTFGEPLPSPQAAPALCVEAFERAPPCDNGAPERGAAIDISRELEGLMDELGLAWDAPPQGPRAADIARLKDNAAKAWAKADAAENAGRTGHKDAVAAVDAAVGNAPWLDVVLPASASLWLAVQPVTLQGCDPPDPVSEAVQVFRLPAVAKGPVRAFVPLPVVNGAFVGVVDAADADAARGAFAAAPLPNHPDVTRGPAAPAGTVVASTLLALPFDCNGCSCWH